jgi:hypothetical protein
MLLVNNTYLALLNALVLRRVLASLLPEGHSSTELGVCVCVYMCVYYVCTVVLCVYCCFYFRYRTAG